MLRERVRSNVAALGLTFGPGKPIRRRPGAAADRRRASGSALRAGLLQRARALNAFLARRLRRASGSSTPASCRARCSRPRAATSRDARACSIPACPPATVAGLDLIRDADGELLVLEDNLRMPSGCDLRDRRARSGRRRRSRRETGAAPPDGFVAALGAAIRAAAPDGRGDPAAAILSDGPESGAYYEHQRLGRELGMPVVDAAPARDRARAPLRPRSAASGIQLDVLYRRTDEDRLTDPRRRAHRARRAAAAGAASRDACAASTPSAPASPTTSSPTPTSRRWSASTSARSRCCARCRATTSPTPRRAPRRWSRLDELVVKPRDGFGGARGDDHAAAPPRRATARRSAWCGGARSASSPRSRSQLSTHPTVCGGAARSRAGSTCAPTSSARPRAPGDGRRPHPLRARRRRDGRQQLPGRRLQGHLGGREPTRRSDVKRRSLASARRPLIGVTTSEVRPAERVDAAARGRAAAAARWRSGLPTCGRSRRPAGCRW